MFANKVVIITGGSSGIGAATAECFAKERATITIVGRNEAKLYDVAERCDKLGAKVFIIKADISKEEEAKTIVKQTVDKFGKLDVLVNNAGIIRFATVEDSNTLEIYDEVMNTNLRASIHLTSLAVPHLIQTKGNIINISSVGGLRMKFPGMSAYAMSKAGMDHFTRSSAIELAPFGVRVNSINPGPVMTDIGNTVQVPDYLLSQFGVDNTTLLKRVSSSEEIGDIVVYMASNKARSITGSCYVVDNGMMIT